MADTNRIELNAVTAVKQRILKSKGLYPYINENDKEPCLDGKVLVYSPPDTTRKENLEGEVPLQIKGTTSKKHLNKQKRELTYPVSVVDLNYYRKIGGCLYFVAYVGENESIVYYKQLLPYDIQKTLNKKNNKNSISLKFKLFPEVENNIYWIFDQFLVDRYKQDPLKKINIPSDLITNLDCKKPISFTSAIPYGEDPVRWISCHPPLLYQTEIINGKEVEIPADVGEFHIRKKVRNPVIVNGETYYDGYSIEHIEKGIQIYVGKCLTLELTEDGGIGKFSVGSKGTLKERLHDLKFIKAFSQNLIISFGPKFVLKFNKNINKKDSLQEQIEYYSGICKMLEIVGAKDKDLLLDDASEQDWKQIDIITNVIFRNAALNIPEAENAEYYSGLFKLVNLHLFLLLYREEDGSYHYFSHERIPADGVGCGQNEKTIVPVDPLLICGDYLTKRIDNIDYSDLLKAIKSGVYEGEEYKNIVMEYGLRILSSVDDYPAEDNRLEVCFSIFNWLYELGFSVNENRINSIQCSFRIHKENLSSEEKLDLHKLIAKCSSQKLNNTNQILTAAYLLLTDYKEAKKIYMYMNDKEKEQFQQYPIYNLYKLHCEKKADSNSKT